jgi:plastocyanin
MLSRALLASSALLAIGAAPAGRQHVVVIDDLKFGAIPAELHRGDTIVWDNRDIFRHTATAQDKSFDVDLQAGAKGRTVLRKAGTIPFLCKYHPGMRGELRVKN